MQFGANGYKTMTESSDAFTYTPSKGEVPEGVYTISGYTSDGTNSTTCSALEYVGIDDDNNAKEAVVVQTQTALDQNNAKNTSTILIIVLIVGAIWYFSKKR
jgi:hypothetical protein